MNQEFEIVGIRDVPPEQDIEIKSNWFKEKPIVSSILLFLIIAGCVGCNWIMTKDPSYMDLNNCSMNPNKEFLFGTDTMGRDIFSMIWSGGRISLFISLIATVISTLIAIIFGSASGSSPSWMDSLLMRFTEIILSVPNLLLVIFIQAILGTANVMSIAFVIGITSWVSIAKIVRTEVRQIRNSDYVVASKAMGGGFFHILWRHLTPNFISSIMFMIVMNIRSAIVTESTLSFMGMGLPLEKISWGSMLSLSDKALMTKAWWIILIPGLFLVVTIMCITNIGNYLRKTANRKMSNL